jgi:hypothetical protein
MDRFDAMTPEQVAVKTLEMLGYTQPGPTYHPSLWMNNGKGWQIGDILFPPYSHAFAAEVKRWMWQEGYEWEDRRTTMDGKPTGGIMFAKDGWFNFGLDGYVVFDNMDAHPLAVCIAALRAQEAEKDAC